MGKDEMALGLRSYSGRPTGGVSFIGRTTLAAVATAAAFLLMLPQARGIRGFNLAVGTPGNIVDSEKQGSSEKKKKKSNRKVVAYSNNPLPAEIRGKLLQVIRELKSRNARFVVKREGHRVSVEEHGFDIIERLFAGVYQTYTGNKTVFVDNLKEAAVITIIGDATEKFRILDWATYAPFILARSETDAASHHLFHPLDYSRVSSSFTNLPIVLADGLVLYSRTGRGDIISNTGGPDHSLLAVHGPVEDLVDEWAFPYHDKKIVLPKANPVASLKGEGPYGHFRLYALSDGRHELRSERSTSFTPPPFFGRPVDYGGGWLFDLGGGKYQLVSRKDGTTSPELVEKPPEPAGDFIVVKSEEGSHIVELNQPSNASVAFTGTPKEFDHYWEVERVGGGYTLIPKKDVNGNVGAFVAPSEPLVGNGILGRSDDGKFNIYNRLDPTLMSHDFKEGPEDFNGAWLSKTAKSGYFLMISQELPQNASPLTATRPRDFGKSALFELPDGNLLVSKKDPTLRSTFFKRVVEPKAGLLGGFFRLSRQSAPTPEWILIETKAGEQVWMSTGDFSTKPQKP